MSDRAADHPVDRSADHPGPRTDPPRPEYPRPQFVRAEWFNLNGQWQFESDRGDSGLARGLVERELEGQILVPFAPESTLSGIGDTDFHQAVWYRRTVTIPSAWADHQVLLHFQAVDYDTTVWANGVEVARHRGGWTPFTANLGDVAGDEVTLVVRARDSKEEPQARGKQSTRYERYGCLYTRTTGIWQTVWLEPVPASRLERPRITPDLAGSAFDLEVPIVGSRRGLFIQARLTDDHGEISTTTVRADLDLAPRLRVAIPAERRRV